MTSGFLILSPFALPSLCFVSHPGKVSSARTSLAVLPASVVILPFTWDTCTLQLKLKTQGYPEPSSFRPFSQLIKHISESGQHFFLLASKVTPGPLRSYAEVGGVIFPNHWCLEAWGNPHAKASFSSINKQKFPCWCSGYVRSTACVVRYFLVWDFVVFWFL